MLVAAAYYVFVPPPGFGEGFITRITIPFVLVCSAFSMMENLRTRTHMSQLIGALRQHMGKAGVPPTPQVKGEAIKILIASLRAENAATRATAADQLHRLTGADHGEDPDAWEAWWADNKDGFADEA